MFINLDDLVAEIDDGNLSAVSFDGLPGATDTAIHRDKMVLTTAQKTADSGRFWAFYDVIPAIRAGCELHRAGVERADYSIGRRENAIDECDPIPADEVNSIPKPVAEFLARFGEDSGSVSAAIADIAAKRWVAGVGYLALIDETALADIETDVIGAKRSDLDTKRLLKDPATRWLVLSDQEIARVIGSENSKPKWQLTNYISADGQQRTRYIADSQIIVIELLKRHPRARHVFDTALRPLTGDCEALLALLRTVRVVANSQAASGILLLPHSTTTPRVRDAEGEQGGKSPSKALAEGLAAPLRDERSVGALLPVILTGPTGDALEQVRWIDLRRQFDKSISDLIDKYDRRIREGLDQQTDEVAGTADQNHWSAMQSANNQKDRYSGREAEAIASLITRGLLRPFLRAHGIIDEWRWGLIVDQSAIDSAQRQYLVLELAKLGVLSNAATLRELGFNAEDAAEIVAVSVGDTASTAPVTAPDKPMGLSALDGIGEAARLHLGVLLREKLGLIAGENDVNDLPPSEVVDVAAKHGLITVEQLDATGQLLRQDLLAELEKQECPPHFVHAICDELLAIWRANIMAHVDR